MTEVIKRYDLQARLFNMFGYQRFNYSHQDFGFSATEAFAEFSGGAAIPDERDTSSDTYRKYLRFPRRPAQGKMGQALSAARA